MDGKRARFEAQVLPHLDAAYRFARWLTRSGADADDIVQEALLRAYRGFDALRGSDIKPWLLTIVRNCHATAHRSRQRHAATVPLPEDNDANEGYAMAASAPGPESAAIESDGARNFRACCQRSRRSTARCRAARTRGAQLSRDRGHDERADRHGDVAPRPRAQRAGDLWLHDRAGELHGVR